MGREVDVRSKPASRPTAREVRIGDGEPILICKKCSRLQEWTLIEEGPGEDGTEIEVYASVDRCICGAVGQDSFEVTEVGKMVN